MSNALMNSLLAFGITSAICYSVMSSAANRNRRRSRADGSGSDSGTYTGTSGPTQ